ncbi:MAG: hypothetical protein J6I47_06645 [Ruminococcus sp.]|nr:hypothetical protein [Ruminococcus sp.]
MKNNNEMKWYAKSNGVFLWEVAEAMGIQDSNLSKLLRHPLSREKENEICAIIDRIAADRKDGNDV